MTPTTPSAPDEVVLLPCPFCGGAVTIEDDTAWLADGVAWIKHAGRPCGLELSAASASELREQWNARLPSPTDTRERVLEEAISAVQGPLSIVHEMIDEGRGNQMTLERLAAYQNAIGLIRALKSKPTEAPVEDGWVRVPKEPTKAMIDTGWRYIIGARSPAPGPLFTAMLAASTKEE